MWCLILYAPPLLYVVPVHRLLARIEKRRSSYGTPPAEALALAVDASLHRLPRPWHWTCLKRATILFALLRRSGEPVQLHIGVKRGTDGTFGAHAWLVRDGQTYLEPVGSGYATFQVITVFPETS